MKKQGILHPELSRVVASLGYTQTLAITEATLPIPDGPIRIDLALTKGVPGFLETLRVILDEMKVESAVIAEEMAQHSPDIYQQLKQLLPGVPIEEIQHVQLKLRIRNARAVVRTGEFTRYANIILTSGTLQ